MTLVVQIPRVSILGNGTLGPYSLNDENSVPIRFVSTSHVKLTRYATATTDNDAGTVLVLDTDYSVGGTQDARTFTLTGSQAVLTSTQRILAERVQAYTQDLDLTTGGSFNAESVESRFDKVGEFQQELKARLDRTVPLQFADATANAAFPSPPTTGAAFLIRNSDGSFDHSDEPDLTTVAGIAEAIEQVAAIDAEVVGVFDALEDIETVADNIGDVQTVADGLGGGIIPNGVAITNLPIVSGVATATKSAHTLQAESGTSDTVTSIDASAFPDGSSGELEIDAGDEITFEEGANLVTETGYDQVAQAGERLKWLRDGSTIYINRILTRRPDMESSLFGVKLGRDNRDRILEFIKAGMETGKRSVFEAPETAGQQYLLSPLSYNPTVGHINVACQPGVAFGYYAPSTDKLFDFLGPGNTYDVKWRGGEVDVSGGTFAWNTTSNTALGVTRARRWSVKGAHLHGGAGRMAYAQPADFSASGFPITNVADNGSGDARFTCSQLCAAGGGGIDTGETIRIWGSAAYSTGPHTVTRIDDDTFDVSGLSYVAEAYWSGDSGISYVDIDQFEAAGNRIGRFCDAGIYASGQSTAGYDPADDGRACDILNNLIYDCGVGITAKRDLGIVQIRGGSIISCADGIHMANAGTPTQPPRVSTIDDILIEMSDQTPIIIRAYPFRIGSGVSIIGFGRRRGTTDISQYTNDASRNSAIALLGASGGVIESPLIEQVGTADSGDRGIYTENTTINSVAHTGGNNVAKGPRFKNIYTPIYEAASVNRSTYKDYELISPPGGVERITLTNVDSYAMPAKPRAGSVNLTPFLSTVDADAWQIDAQNCDWEEVEPGIVRVRARVQVRITTLGSGSGEFRLSGFPRTAFSDANESDYIPVMNRAAAGLTSVPAGTTEIVLRMNGNAATCQFHFAQPNTATTVIAGTHMVVGTPIRFEWSGTYKSARPLVLS
jgi:hypothetical protein